MRKNVILMAVVAFCAMRRGAEADYSVANRGTWPESWPKALEPLRKQATTLVGPLIELRHFLIPFAKREEFESAWPHILKIKSKGAPIILVRGPKTDFMQVEPAGVLIHSPPAGTDQQANPEQPLRGDWSGNERTRWMWTTYIELVVDGNVVDLNRISLPADTPIIDERFKDVKDRNVRQSAN
jgi:hypothetical protein